MALDSTAVQKFGTAWVGDLSPRRSPGPACSRLNSTAAWQKTRRAILARDGHICQLRGPKCTGIATTVHHLLPSSQYPHLFFDASNLAAACRPCNYSGGREIQLANRTDRQLLSHYELIIEHQRAEIDELTDWLAERDGGDAEPRRVPRIY